jgi:hypothetical protein
MTDVEEALQLGIRLGNLLAKIDQIKDDRDRYKRERNEALRVIKGLCVSIEYLAPKAGAKEYGIAYGHAQELLKGAFPAVAIDDEADEEEIKEWDIWVEGYKATGESSTAKFLGTEKGRTFRDACVAYAEKNPKWAKDFDPGRLEHWGCALYNNETDARAAFG